jgi:hypothetical protein
MLSQDMFNFTFPILILKPWIKEERWSFVWNIYIFTSD